MISGTAPGRNCPLHYRYEPEVFLGPVAESLTDLDVLYVVGGLYGNELALDEVLNLFAEEAGRKRLVFNGDFHWFDADPVLFERIQRRVLAHHALRGNVETELAQANAVGDAGCGCAYPDWVDDGVVNRSNQILQRLWSVATPALRQQLAELPMWQLASVGGMRFALVHGDAQSLAGWGFAQEHLRWPSHRDEVRQWFSRAKVDAFVCTHTCLPVFQNVAPSGSSRASWIFNNGAAGMPNFHGDSAGLLTRIALTPYRGPARRFGIVQDGIHVDAIGIEFPTDVMRQRFLRLWPEGSDAYESYFARISIGPSYGLEQVIRQEN